MSEQAITIVHLSDFHFGHNASRARWTAILEQAHNDLVKNLKLTSVDLVLLTGDIANRGLEEEYGNAERELASLINRLGFTGSAQPRVVAIPGNHDLVRPVGDPTAVLSSAAPRNFEEMLDAQPTSVVHGTVSRAFEHFDTWSATSSTLAPPEAKGQFPGDAIYTITTALGDLRVVALNSAISQLTGADYDGRLAISNHQIDELAEAARNMEAPFGSILLTHHPRSWLTSTSQDKLSELIQATCPRFLGHFYGHRHVRDLSYQTRDGRDHWLNWQGASFFGLEYDERGKEDRIHGYSALRISRNGRGLVAAVAPRRAERHDDRVWRFDRDPASVELGSDSPWSSAVVLVGATEMGDVPEPPQAQTPSPVTPTESAHQALWPETQQLLNSVRAAVSAARNHDSQATVQLLQSLSRQERLRGLPNLSSDATRVVAGRRFLAENFAGTDLAAERLWVDSNQEVRAGMRVLALVLGIFAAGELDADEATESPDAEDALEYRECIWAWQELIVRGLPDRDALCGPEHAPTTMTHRVAMPDSERRRWANQRTSSHPRTAGEKRAAARITAVLDAALVDSLQTADLDPGLDVLGELLPPSLAKATRERISRRTQGSLTEYQRNSLPVLAQALANGDNVLLSAVTGSGKSFLGQIVAAHIVSRRESGHSRKRAMIVLPIKALVSDVVDELNGWFEQAGLNYRVLGGSRDFPENVDALASGRYEVAVEIYESLDCAISAGQDPLRGCGVLIVDELQYLNDLARGAKLESLLVKVKMRYPDLPIVAISAVLDPSSREEIAKWLSIPDERRLHTEKRPVPLNTRAYDGERWRMLHDVEAVGAASTPASVSSGDLDIRERVAKWGQDEKIRNDVLRPAFRGGGTTVPALIAELLTADADQRILVYTNSRGSAQNLTLAIQNAMDLELGRVRRTNANPWLNGRYGSPEDPDIAASKMERLRRTASHAARKDVETALMTGCAYHTRQLTRPLRELVQDEFREGLIRVLVTTDTLSVGLNLPVDTVVVGTPTISTGQSAGEVRSLDLGELKNRIGRAGRLGLKTAGDAWVLTAVPDFVRRSLRRDDALEPATLCSLDGIWESYVLPRGSGTVVQSHLDSGDLELIVLQDAVASHSSFTTAEFVERADLVAQTTLRASLGSSMWSGEEILSSLLDASVLEQDSSGRLSVSPLGVALAIHNLPISAAGWLKRLADSAFNGESDVDLIALAVQAPNVETVKWLNLAPWIPDWTAGEFALRSAENAERLARPMFLEPEERLAAYQDLRYLLTTRDPHASLAQLPVAVTSASPAASDGALGDLLQGRSTPLELTTITFRAMIVFFWMAGVPFQDIRGYIESVTKFEKDRRAGRGKKYKTQVRRVTVHYADVEGLCDQVGMVLSAADVYARSRNDGHEAINLGPLAEQVRSGVPTWLTPLLELHINALHRERLLALSADDPAEELQDVLGDTRIDLTPAEVERATDQLVARDRGALMAGSVLPDGVRTRPVGGDPDAPTYGDFYSDITQASSSSDAVELVGELFRLHGLHVSAGDGLLISDGGRSVTVKVAPERVTTASLEALRSVHDVPLCVCCLAGLSSRAVYIAKSELRPGTTVFPEIDSLLVFLDRCTSLAFNESAAISTTVVDQLSSVGGLRTVADG